MRARSIRRGVATLRGLTVASRLGAPRLARLFFAMLVVLAGTLALAAGSASAATGHRFLEELKVGGTALSGAEAVTIDSASGDIFVVSGGEEVVDVFESTGKLKTQFGAGILEGEMAGIAVDSSGRVYVADRGTDTVDVFKPNGSGGYELLATWTGAGTGPPETTFGELRGIAVDNSTSPSKGEVYVSDTALVDVFKPQAESKEEPGLLTTINGKPEFEEVGGVAVSATTGQVYVAATKEGEKGYVEVFSAAHAFQVRLAGKGTPGGGLGALGSIAVEEATGDVYVADTEVGALDQLSPAGEWVGWVRAGPGGRDLSPQGVVVAPSGKLYVASGSVEIFGLEEPVPDVRTGVGKSSKAKPVVVTLTGGVNPLGGEAKYHFEYGPASGPGGGLTTSTETGTVPGVNEEVKVSAQVKGLSPGTPYIFRLVAEGANHLPNYGATSEFITAEAVAGVETLPATGIEAMAATLNGSLEPQKFPTKYYFEWGETTLYGNNSPVPFGETSEGVPVPVKTQLTGLKPGVTYHYRLVGSNQFGISYGGDAQFATAGPAITTEPATPVSPSEETLGTKINPNKLKTKVHFQWGETTGYGEVTPTEKLGEFPQAVKATVKGLKLATTYHFRVVVEVENEKAEVISTSFGPDQEFTSRLIEGESAIVLSSEAALLKADLNPTATNGEPPKTVSCQFEYGTSVPYSASVPCEPASSSTTTAFSGQASGLLANTTYHYRVTATLEGEHASGADQTFTTPAAGVGPKLPDGRGYEMVSPPNKQGGYIEPLTFEGGTVQASEDGNALAYVVDGPIVEDVEGNRSPESQQILSTRGSGWANQEITPPHGKPAGLRTGEADDEFQLFSSNLALALAHPFPFGATLLAEPPLAPPLSEAERGHQEKTMYLRSNAPIVPDESEETIYNEAKQNGETLAKEHGGEASPGYLPLVTAANTVPGVEIAGELLKAGVVKPYMRFLSATPDLTHVVLGSRVALTPEQPSAPAPTPGFTSLYEWSAGKLQLVSVLPNGQPASNAQLGTTTGDGSGSNYPHAISNDGTRVVWTVRETGSEVTGLLGHIYMRDTAEGKTLQLDTAEPNLPKPEPGQAFFQTASADGSKVFFTDTQRLTADATANVAKPDLYVCEVSGGACTLKDVTKNPGESANVLGQVLGASKDGSYVYFVATGALAAGAKSGADNLYVSHSSGTKWVTSLVAILSSEDSPDWFNVNRTSQRLVDQTARVSPSGQYLAFMSNRSLTGYNNIDINEETGKHADEEVFLYDAFKPHLGCASCNPTGARPRGVFDTEFAGEGLGLRVDRPNTWSDHGGNLGVAHWLAGSIPGWTALDNNQSIYQSRYLSDTGRLFLTSADPLVPGIAAPTRKEIISGKEANVGVENVYEYKPNEVGDCATAAGCVGLISSGTSEKESAFLDASASGSDVFFVTAASLLPQDEDGGSYDVYDARVCGEAGCIVPPPKPGVPCGSIRECRGESSPPPTFAPAPGFSGPGNTPHKVGGGATLPSKISKPALTNSQKLALALKSCRKLPHKSRAQKKKRAKCEATARKKYAAKKAAKHATHSSSAGGKR